MKTPGPVKGVYRVLGSNSPWWDKLSEGLIEGSVDQRVLRGRRETVDGPALSCLL